MSPVLKVSHALAFLALALLAALSLSSPEDAQGGEIIVKDDLGQQVKLPKEVKNVVSLVPTSSEMVCLLDCDRLKGGTRYDRSSEELARRMKAKEIEIVGGGFDPNLEKIVEIGPDLILANGPSQQRAVSVLRRMGYPVLSLHPRNFDGIKKNFLLLGEILQRSSKAKKLLHDIEAREEEMRRKTHGKKPKRAYLQTWASPMITVGNDSFPQWLLSLAGGRNIFSDMAFNSGKVGVESVILRNPEVLIFTDGQERFVKKILSLPEWNAIEGVRTNHICFVEEVYLRPSIEFLQGAEIVHRCLFGGTGLP